MIVRVVVNGSRMHNVQMPFEGGYHRNRLDQVLP